MQDNHEYTNEPDFNGKVVSFSTLENTLAVKDIEFKILKKRLFIVGTIPRGATNNDWANGRNCAIAWDSVTDYIVFDSEQQYAELIARSE